MMNMSKKDISSVPKEAVDNAVEARVTGADLSRNRLTEFPTVIQPLLPLLSQLDISFNRLDLVPPMIGLGQNLQYINLSNNKLTQLPDELANLPQLREICLSFNKFTNFPACIYNLSKLEILVAESNQVGVQNFHIVFYRQEDLNTGLVHYFDFVIYLFSSKDLMHFEMYTVHI
jgi:Leucine-rich repeat (LRR) protein